MVNRKFNRKSSGVGFIVIGSVRGRTGRGVIIQWEGY